MNNYNVFRDNYPIGFNGVEGEDEKEFSFYVQGEPAQSHYSRESALEELKDKTLRELIADGTIEIN